MTSRSQNEFAEQRIAGETFLSWQTKIAYCVQVQKLFLYEHFTVLYCIVLHCIVFSQEGRSR